MSEKRKPSHGRGMLIPWQPGQSGNPAGLSKLEGEMIRAARSEGLESVRFLITVRDDQVDDAKGKRVRASVRERIVAAGLLLDRGFGKPKEHIEIKNDRPRPDLSALTPKELEQFAKLLGKAAAAGGLRASAEKENEE